MICKTRSEGFGPEVQRRILLGSYVLSAGYYDAYYKKAQNLRGAVIKGFNEAFARCDVILAPTVPMTAFPKGFAVQDQVQTYQTDVCTVPVNIAGIPALSMPCGYDQKSLPIGMQLIANRFEETKLLQTAYWFEQEMAGEIYRKTEWGAVSMREYELVAGLETHVELSTKTKIFCGCTTAFGGEPNTHCCPICIGLPGVLPKLNRQVVRYGILAGLATNCRINPVSKMDRKTMFTRICRRHTRFPSTISHCAWTVILR